MTHWLWARKQNQYCPITVGTLILVLALNRLSTDAYQSYFKTIPNSLRVSMHSAITSTLQDLFTVCVRPDRMKLKMSSFVNLKLYHIFTNTFTNFVVCFVTQWKFPSDFIDSFLLLHHCSGLKLFIWFIVLLVCDLINGLEMIIKSWPLIRISEVKCLFCYKLCYKTYKISKSIFEETETFLSCD